MRVSNVLLKPIITEKSMAMSGEQNTYIFEINLKASKGAVANEVTRIYGVEVKDVRTIIMPGKKRRLLGTRRFIKTKKRKKAIVKLKEGQTIDLIGS